MSRQDANAQFALTSFLYGGNASYIEEIARKELGLIGEKENVIVLEQKKDASSAAPAKKGTGRP